MELQFPFLTAFDNLHDATLLAVHLDCTSGECIASFDGAPHIPNGPFRLRWTDVSDIHVPRRLEWGPSVSVLSAEENAQGCYALHLQSGDILTIRASGLTFER